LDEQWAFPLKTLNTEPPFIHADNPGGWQDYRVDGERVLSPVNIETLKPGYYRQVESV
jgi:hypothetical protein